MAKDKKSFILYADQTGLFEKLTDAKAGKLIKHIFDYVNDKNPSTEDILLMIAFEPIKLQLKRDLKRWERYIEKQSENGKLGGRPLKDKSLKTQKTQAFFEKAKKADNANVTVNVNDTVIYDAEAEILKNQIWLEKMGIKHHRSLSEVTEILHTYHLYLEEKEQYPRGKKACFSGFEKWLINEKKFNNGYKANSVSNRHAGAAQLTESLWRDHAAGK